MPRLAVARQPIFDRDLRVVGYELLYRDSSEGGAVIADPERATARVLMDGLSDIGLNELVGPRRAFVNFTREFLLEAHPLPLPPGRVVIELLEDQEVDDRLMATLRELTRAGFVIALDDATAEAAVEPLLGVASIVKIDVLRTGESEAIEFMREIQERGITVVAEKVETREQYDRFREAGFDFFQGFFFARPETVEATRMPGGAMGKLGALVRLQEAGRDFDALERMLREDAALSFRLLRYANSAFFNVDRSIDSVHDALTTLGATTVHRWATILALAELAEDSPPEVLTTALVRARMCEALAPDPLTAEHYFTVGLFSVLDALLDLPLLGAIEGLPLSETTRSALLWKRGPAGTALSRTLRYERADFGQIIDVERLARAYGRATSWADAARTGIA